METLNALEWDRFIELAGELARSEPGFERIDELFDMGTWAGDLSTARLKQQETHEISSLLDREALWGPLTELENPLETLETLAKGGVLEVERLAFLRRWLYAIDSWSALPRETLIGENFRRALGAIMDPREPIRILSKVLTPEGELSEKATPKLGSLYSEIRHVRAEIAKMMDRLVQKYTQSGVLQESFSDVHDGRYVVPVRTGAQGDIEGIIYGSSSTRQTVFVEPAEVAPLNNRLKQKESELSQEIFAIMEATCKQLKPFVDEIEGSVKILAYWDAVQARAALGRKYGGKMLEVIDGSAFHLRQTAHPLLFWSLDPEKITRNNLEWGDPSRTLLLTGPNTGGKTVLMKTLGLAGICARTGFPFPGTEEQTVPFFDDFFVDIGDPQSIEVHLSSFSGHIERFKDILQRVDSRSLVLLDELNTATDPGEGAALGRAFLETVMARGALIVATTHDPQLKALALHDDRILCASMAFDEASRSPTFSVVIGIPGRSRALETAERLGLPAEVLTLARTYLTDDHLKFEETMARLETETRDAEKARRDAFRMRDEAERLKKEWTERTEKNVAELMDRTRQKLKKVLEDAQDEVRTKVRRLDELKNRREIDQTRGGINEAFTEATGRMESALREEAPDLAQTLENERLQREAAKERNFEVGETVRIPKWKNIGKILTKDGDKLKIQMGMLQVQMTVDDVEKANEKEKQKSSSTGFFGGKTIAKASYAKPEAPTSQLDLRGKRFEDAMMELEAYLDISYRSGGLKEVTVVHGVGTGALREGTKKLLHRLPYVKTSRDGGVGLGGSGATIVEFED